MIVLKLYPVILMFSLVIISMVYSEDVLMRERQELQSERKSLSQWLNGLFGKDDSDIIAARKKLELEQSQRIYVLNIILGVIYMLLLLSVLFYRLGNETVSVLLLIGSIQLMFDTANIENPILPVGILVLLGVLIPTQ